jgi:hypothetical protein
MTARQAPAAAIEIGFPGPTIRSRYHSASRTSTPPERQRRLLTEALSGKDKLFVLALPLTLRLPGMDVEMVFGVEVEELEVEELESVLLCLHLTHAAVAELSTAAFSYAAAVEAADFVSYVEAVDVSGGCDFFLKSTPQRRTGCCVAAWADEDVGAATVEGFDLDEAEGLLRKTSSDFKRETVCMLPTLSVSLSPSLSLSCVLAM